MIAFPKNCAFMAFANGCREVYSVGYNSQYKPSRDRRGY